MTFLNLKTLKFEVSHHAQPVAASKTIEQANSINPKPAISWELVTPLTSFLIYFKNADRHLCQFTLLLYSYQKICSRLNQKHNFESVQYTSSRSHQQLKTWAGQQEQLAKRQAAWDEWNFSKHAFPQYVKVDFNNNPATSLWCELWV